MIGHWSDENKLKRINCVNTFNVSGMFAVKLTLFNSFCLMERFRQLFYLNRLYVWNQMFES